ncbi:PAS domain-containing protein [Haloarchaeobius sp. HRN-SO-5]|uniref:PAS domain-containing protein n=1 Tax=Haloarchaeobius sp. HRN-SO-5 TaxID=3446118 RepID=UPI003EBC428B
MTTALRVLCVDDDRDAVRLTAEYLEKGSESVECLTETSAEVALERFDTVPIDCVVSDYEMADIDGVEFLESIRERDERVPFILFTARGSEDVASEAISAGVTDYLRKQGSNAHGLLLNRIENAVDQYWAEAELQRTKTRLEGLHRHAVEISGAQDHEEAARHALVAADDILDFHVSGIYTLDGERFVPRSDLSYRPEGDLPTPDDGVLGRTYRENESFLVHDTRDDSTAEPDQPEFRSAVSVPVDGYGVFQAISERPNAFTETDRELAELLTTHVSQAFDRIESDVGLRRTNEQLQAILDNTTANIYIKDLDGRYQLVNERFRELLGLSEEEIVGHTDFDVQSHEDAERVRENDRTAIRRGEPIEVEEHGEFEGNGRTYYSVKVPLYDEGGDPVGVCGISSDITELKEREAELERQKERLDEFARLVSHDLKSPLTVAQGYLELVREDVEHPNLADVAEAHDRIQEIIEGLLTLAREGREIGECEAVSVERLATRAWGSVDAADAELHVDCELTVSADRNRLCQVFENLFTNAIEHALPDASDEPLTVRVGRLDDGQGFYVADDGTGVPESLQSDPFEPGKSSESTGTGFGLAIVDKVVTAHGWTVDLVDSESGGARFEIRT